MSKRAEGLLHGLLVFLCLLLSGPAQALFVDGDRYQLSKEVEFLEDPSGDLTLAQLLDNPDKYPFIHSREAAPASRSSPVWVKLDLSFSEEARQKRYYLIARVENLNEIRFYRPVRDSDGEYREIVTGNNYPASTRELPAPRYGFLIEPGGESMTLYLRITGGPGTANFPWGLVEERVYKKNARLYYLFDVACLSAIAALLVFNLSIALSLRKAEYGWYCGYVFFVLMALITLDGLGFYYIWPDYPALNDRALHSFNLLAAATRLLTILSYLGVAGFAPRMYRGALGILVLMAINLLLVNLLGTSGLPAFTAPIPWLIGILYGFVICGYAIHKGVRLAIPLFIALLVPSVAAIIQAVIIIRSTEVSILDLQLAKIGFVLHILMFSVCLAARIKLETESRKLALRDGLTGLPGTTLLQERFDLAANLSQRQSTGMAVFFLDLDGFKAVNDKQGHAAGDQLLTEIARRMQQLLRGTDTVARIGGDEFVILITQLQEAKAIHQVAQKLLSAVAEPCLIDSVETQVSASIGISMYPAEGEDLETLLQVADTCMYAAKRNGKNTYSTTDRLSAAAPGQTTSITPETPVTTTG